MAASAVLQTNSTYAFTLNATKDGVVWNISGATVTVTFCSPRGVEASFSATVTDGPNGVAVFTCATTDLKTVKGLEQWTRVWTVSVGGVVQDSAPIPFTLQIAKRAAA